MAADFLKLVKNQIRHWYLLLIVGIILIGMGIYTFSSPLTSYLALSFLFSVSFLASGISEIVFAIANRKEITNWWWTLIFGIITAAVGVMLITSPAISMTTLAFYIGITILFRSIGAISLAWDLKSYGVSDWQGLMFIGILSLLFSFILLWNPLFAGMSLVFWTATAFIMAGIFSIYFSLKLRKLHRLPRKIAKSLQG